MFRHAGQVANPVEQQRQSGPVQSLLASSEYLYGDGFYGEEPSERERFFRDCSVSKEEELAGGLTELFPFYFNIFLSISLQRRLFSSTITSSRGNVAQTSCLPSPPTADWVNKTKRKKKAPDLPQHQCAGAWESLSLLGRTIMPAHISLKLLHFLLKYPLRPSSCYHSLLTPAHPQWK